MNPTRIGRTSARARLGVTLIECMIASTILIVAITAFGNGFRLGIRAARRARGDVVAASLVRRVFAQLDGEGFAAASRSGSFAPEFPDYTYTVEVRPTALKTYKRVSVTVRWLEGGAARAIAVESGLGDRAAKKPAAASGPGGGGGE